RALHAAQHRLRRALRLAGRLRRDGDGRPAGARRGDLAMTPLLPGSTQGRVLKLPSLSLWGGVDPFSGKLTDPALPHCGDSVKDRVLMIGEPVGSSSSSAVLLELLH